MLLPLQPSTQELELRSDRAGVALTSGALRLRAERQPWRLAVYDRGGRQIFRQQRQDRAMMGYVAQPTGYSTDPAGGVAFHETFCLREDEQLFGLGMQFGPLNKRGQRLVSWTRDTYGFTSSSVTYMNVPFFLSSRGYGIFINHTSPITYEWAGHPGRQLPFRWKILIWTTSSSTALIPRTSSTVTQS